MRWSGGCGGRERPKGKRRGKRKALLLVWHQVPAALAREFCFPRANANAVVRLVRRNGKTEREKERKKKGTVVGLASGPRSTSKGIPRANANAVVRLVWRKEKAEREEERKKKGADVGLASGSHSTSNGILLSECECECECECSGEVGVEDGERPKGKRRGKRKALMLVWHQVPTAQAMEFCFPRWGKAEREKERKKKGAVLGLASGSRSTSKRQMDGAAAGDGAGRMVFLFPEAGHEYTIRFGFSKGAGVHGLPSHSPLSFLLLVFLSFPFRSRLRPFAINRCLPNSLSF
ncbi:hypothetical protein ACLOJK_025279, partial [Asimina triloba]